MKRFLLFILTIFICGVAAARTINWHDGDTTTQTTCTVGDNITPPTPIGKYGYTFVKWEVYTPIEYLESTGTQGIDTGLVPNGSYKVKTKLTFTSEKSGQGYFGESSTQMIQISNDAGYINVSYAGNNLRTSTIIFNRETHEYEFNISNGNCYLKQDNIIINSSNCGSYSASKSVFLFRINGLNLTSLCKIHFFQIYHNNILVRDFIPVLDANGTPCMYDKVEKKFYYNAGTGQFIAGPVLTE